MSSNSRYVPSNKDDICHPKVTTTSMEQKNGTKFRLFAINLGGKQNRLSSDSFDEFHEIFDKIENTEGPKALVITANGKFFSNGLDVESLKNNPYKTLADTHEFLKRLLTFPIPTVAAINGHAFGGGAMIALACDYRVMTNYRGFVGFPELNIGLVFTPGTYAIVRSKVDRSQWADMLLGVKHYTANDLLKYNIINIATEPDKIMEHAIEIAKSKAHYGENSIVYNQVKRQLYFSEIKLLEEGFGFADNFLRKINSKL